MTKKISYSKDIINYKQIRSKKQKLTIDVVLNLIYSVQIVKNRDSMLSCLLIDIKEAYNYISLIQLINIFSKET